MSPQRLDEAARSGPASGHPGRCDDELASSRPPTDQVVGHPQDRRVDHFDGTGVTDGAPPKEILKRSALAACPLSVSPSSSARSVGARSPPKSNQRTPCAFAQRIASQVMAAGTLSSRAAGADQSNPRRRRRSMLRMSVCC
jgi:hypothetical protein